MTGFEEKMVDMVLIEYRRIMELKGGFFGTRDAELKKFWLKINTMKKAGMISACELEEIKHGVKIYDSMMMKESMKEIAEALKK